MESFISVGLKVQLFLSIFISTIAIGGMFQNKIWAKTLWIIISILYNWTLVYWYNIQEISLIVAFSILTIFSIFLLRRK